MAIFGMFKSGKEKELDRLDHQARENPSPQAMIDLADKAMAFEQEALAQATAKRALETYPHMDPVRSMYQRIMRNHIQTRLLQLQKSLAGGEAPESDYAALADLYYRELGNIDKALETTRDGLKRHPDGEGLHWINGLVRFDRFHEDFIANDGLKAIDHLARAVAANPMNYKASLTLARLYAEAGALGKARERVAALLQTAPGDEKATKLQKELEAVANAADAGEDLEEAFRGIEEHGALGPVGQRFARLFDARAASATMVRVQPVRVNELLKKLAAVGGFEAAVAINETGEVVGDHTRGNVLPGDLARIILTIHRQAEDSSRRMDLGNFRRGIIEWPKGRIHLAEWKNLVFGILTTEGARSESAMEGEIDRILNQVAVG